MERLDKRVVLASDIGAIAGTVYIDLNGDGLDAGDTRIAGVDVSLYGDGGDGIFTGAGPGGDDTLIGTDISDSLASATPGAYRFDGLSPGLYFIQQDDADVPAGLINPDPISVTVVNDQGVQVQAIDTYDETAQSLTVNSADPTLTDIIAAPEVVGGERDIEVTYDSGTGDITLQVDPASDQLRLSAEVGTVGNALIQYDGIDGVIALAAEGLGTLNLNGGDDAGGINVRAEVDGVGDSFQLTIYTNATDFSTVTVAYPAEAALGPVDIYVPFASFAQGGGATAPADFASVGAIELITDVSSGRDISISVLESVQPLVVETNLQNIQPLTVGDLVFRDNDNDGIFGAGDVGLANVDVELYAVASAAAVVDPDTQTPFATTTTDANGAYSFTDVEPGFYVIVIPEREFDASSSATGARTLVGFSTSTPTPETAGADADVDNDDDGRAVTGELYVASGVFSLIAGDEPTDGGNTNDTIDFGFISNADLQITKTFVSLDTATDGTRTATFRIDVLNNGPLAATGISVVDTLPAGLTFDGLTSTSSATAAPAGVTSSSVAGNVVTIELIDLGSSAGTSFHLVAIVGAGVFGDLTNSATVAGDQNDPTPTNNDDDVVLNLPESDLSLTKTLETTAGSAIPPATARTGDTVVYRLVVTNEGPDNATGVSVVDTLPADVTFVSGTINGGTAGTGITFNSATRQVTAAVGNVTTATPAIILLTVTVNSDAADLITNTATVSNSPDTDDNTANDTDSVDNNISRAVDLDIDKAVSTNAADNTVAAFGAPITFVITVTNATTSPGDARGFTVTDTLPTGLTFVSGSFDAGTSGVTVVNSGQLLTFTGAALEIGESVSFTFDALVAQNAGTTITNTAEVAPVNAGGVVDVDINSANDSDTETITPARNVELVVTKDDNFTGTASATPGGNIVYTIVVTNTGVSDAVNVTVTDTLPAGVTATSITVDGSQVTDNNPDAGILSFVIPSVPTGAANAVSVEVTASIAATATGNITNSVAISGGGAGDLPAGNTASVTTPLTPVLDVALTKTGPANAIPGSTTNISYTLTVINATGPSAATNVTVTDTLPAGVTFQSATLNGTAITPTIAGQVLTFTIPSVTAGATGQSLVINARVTDSTLTGTIVNNATVAATGDSNANNNNATFTTTLTPNADIGVAKTVSSAAAGPGDSLTYTIVVTNGGPSTAAGVTLVDVLPTGLTFTSGTGPGGQVLTATGQTVNVTVGTLAPAATQTYTIVAAISSTFTGNLVNPATVATTTSEGANTLANTASVTTVVTDVDPMTGSISGRVFRDGNNNGLFDNSDVGIPGVTVRLRAAGTTTPLQTAVTGSDGTYTFTGLGAGTYEIEEVQPAGITDGLEQAGPAATPTQLTDSIFRNVGLDRDEDLIGFNFAEVEALSKRRFLASTGT